ncbi:hypothetical protein FACS189467_7230 [Bacteroidia bacterium]|nr:hypothetical protein FACS189467_7230 [Bacteroidia bacterium]
MPAGLTSIGYSAFGWCDSITYIINLNPTPQVIDNTVFQYVDLSNDTLYVPVGSLAAYQAADGWKDFGTILAISVTDLQAQIAALQRQLAAANSTISTLQNEKGTLQTHISALQTDSTSKQGQINTLQSDKTTLQTEKAALQSQLTACQNGNATAIQTKAIEELSVFPNPTATLLTITNDQWQAGDLIEIYSINGTLKGTWDVASETTTINIGHLPTGVYIVKVGDKVAKVVKQ